jgi:hyperosmotically inducible periplasmic protein
MQISHFIGAGVMAAALLSSSAFAQTSTTNAVTTQAPAASDKKAVRAENRQTSRAVRHALTATKGLVSANIAILAKGDVVTLVGSVPDSVQIQLAESAAKRVPQVHSVDNRLIVEEEEGGRGS